MTATRAAVGQNTNLGIILLAAPLVMAAEQPDPDLRTALRRVLDQATMADAEAVFRAIRHAAPGGLGQAPRHDVHAPPTVPLSVAMAEAAHRDSIARQWATGFADVFGPGLKVYRAAGARWPDPAWAALAAYLWFLVQLPDSHIARRHGAEAADRVRRASHTGSSTPAGRRGPHHLPARVTRLGPRPESARDQSRYQRRSDCGHYPDRSALAATCVRPLKSR